ncbi:hypothetical protein HN014_22220 (plasmid) [Aquimarina sp. TRL1]|uniref:hypothetical protein n=1 Tax=Aquimarina sp. (strain TRL1) TaxID=2736252 RepID=UPI00158CD3BD|nr:hypothetical protein [Aquimarina sp. TRL1]QKX07718.1 hypothetical protein HN014_22220 [Aquimarina sp. TRL1]
MKTLDIIEQLKEKKAYSYNDMKRRFKSMEHRIVMPPLVVERFLEYFNNDLIYTYAKNEKEHSPFIENLNSALDDLAEIRELVESDKFPKMDQYVMEFCVNNLKEIKDLLIKEQKAK